MGKSELEFLRIEDGQSDLVPLCISLMKDHNRRKEQRENGSVLLDCFFVSFQPYSFHCRCRWITDPVIYGKSLDRSEVERHFVFWQTRMQSCN